MQDVDPDIRRDSLEAYADEVIEDFEYTVALSNEEIQAYEKELSHESIQLASLQEELKLIQANFKGRMKSIKEKINELLSMLKAETRREQATCYVVFDRTNRLAIYYNEQGFPVHKRPMVSGDNQFTLSGQLREEVEVV